MQCINEINQQSMKNQRILLHAPPLLETDIPCPLLCIDGDGGDLSRRKNVGLGLCRFIGAPDLEVT